MKLSTYFLFLSSAFTIGSAVSTEVPNRALQGNGNKNGNGNGNKNGNSNGRGPPAWVLEKLPEQVVAKFQEENMLRDDAAPSYQSIPGGSQTFDIEGNTVSLDNEDLIPLSVMAAGGRVTVDGKAQLLFPSVYKSRYDESILVAKNANGKLVSASKMSRGRTVKVLPVARDGDVYMTISSDDLDQDKLSRSIILRDELYDKSNRHLRQGGASSTESDVEKSVFDRELQTSCTEFRVVEIGIFVDSYMCANEGNSPQAAFDKAAMIVAQTSQKYQVAGLCMKFEVLDIDVYCDPGNDPMRSHVAAQTDSVCNVLTPFKNWVGNTNNNPPSGDIVHLFSGRDYPSMYWKFMLNSAI